MSAREPERPGYKQTEVGVIPKDWVTSELSAVATMKSGVGITSAHIDQTSEHPCYGGNGIRGFTAHFTHDGSYALIGRQGALCGNVSRVDGKFFASEHAIVVTAADRTDIDWLALVLGDMRLNRFSESSAQPGLSVTKVLSLRVVLPPTKAEQSAISAALSDVGALIASLDALIAKKRDIKQAAMQQLLTGKTRLPRFVGEWFQQALGDLGEWKGGGTPSMTMPNYWSNGSISWVSSSEMKSARLWSTEQKITPQALAESSTILTPVGSILVVIRSGILRRYLPVALSMAPLAINQDIKALIPKDRFVGEYVFYSILAYGPRILATCMKSGTTVESVDLGWLKRFVISVPVDVAEQSAIAGILSDIDAEIVALEAKRDKTRALKQGMTQELLTGRIRLV